MGRNRVCEACGAREWFRNGFFANFPLDENRCKEWVRLCGKEDLAFLPIEKLNQLRFVCGDHFDKKDFNRKGNRLKKKAIPKLKLIAAPLADYMLEDFPLHVASKQIAVQPSLSTRPLDGSSKPSFLGPSTSSSSNDVHTHRFPDPNKYPEQFQNWFSLVRGTSATSSDYEFYKSKVICERHFTDADRNRNNRLKRSAVPSLSLGTGLSDHRYIKDKVHNDHSYVKIGVSGMRGTKRCYIPGADNDRGTVSHVADGVHNDTCTDEAEESSENASTDPESRKSIKAGYSWETEELIIAADDTDVVQPHQEVSAHAALDRDLTEPSLFQDDNPFVSDDYSGYDHSYGCNECGGSILGFRYTCVQCVDWDLCGACEARAAHAAHYVLRIPSARPYKEIQAVLATIRQHLLSENHFEPERALSVKSEPEELQEPHESQEPQEPQKPQEPPPEGDPLGDWDVEFLDSSDIDDVPEGSAERGAAPAPPAPAPDCSEPILNRLPVHITKPIVVETSEVSPISSQSEDNLDPHQTETSATATRPTPAISNIQSAKNILVRIPAGFDPVRVVKMLKPHVSVRLKAIEESSAKVNTNTDH